MGSLLFNIPVRDVSHNVLVNIPVVRLYEVTIVVSVQLLHPGFQDLFSHPTDKVGHQPYFFAIMYTNLVASIRTCAGIGYWVLPSACILLHVLQPFRIPEDLPVRSVAENLAPNGQAIGSMVYHFREEGLYCLYDCLNCVWFRATIVSFSLRRVVPEEGEPA